MAESYGGKDEPVDGLVTALVAAGVEPLLEPLRVKDEPTEAGYQVGGCRRAGGWVGGRAAELVGTLLLVSATPRHLYRLLPPRLRPLCCWPLTASLCSTHTICCLQLFEEVGTDLAQALTTKDAIAKKKAMAPEVAKALARVSGGLYIGAPPHSPGHSIVQHRALPL